ncbi:MAG TPA: tRNA (adenosine(37)-N6)-threonylcarbamoyltransferase complex dimerization subunit type 1 TsaB [Streptosporangiaceae bacterium]|nr:tRNA (adenosine(37)-N6)-threonylcarbamoyltransferase complex dimerization subunit type 1 TsaB [Streptosporangiaceae bacterium]
MLLAFDTATPAVTVALHDGTRVVAGESAVDARRHGELLAATIDKVLAAAGATRRDLTAIAVGTGPGPYTGLRAGLVTARVLGSALGLPVDGICTLDVIAADAVAHAGGGEFLVATDARRKELYWARYSAGGQRLAGPQVSPMSELASGLPVAGQGALLYPETGARPIEPQYPAASRLAALAAQRQAAGLPPAPAHPLYLRRPDAREPGRPKRVTP